MTCVRLRVAKRHLGGGIGGLPPTGRQVDNLLCICDSSLRLLLLLVQAGGSWGRTVSACVPPGWGRCRVCVRLLWRIRRNSCSGLVIRNRGKVY